MALSAWRARLQPASYNGAGFKVDVNVRISGRRVAEHEFPKKDLGYAEDMGRKSRHFTLHGYVIGNDYTDLRDALIEQLEKAGNGQLILPTGMDQDSQTVVVETYSVTERRERGGVAEFDIAFIEAGQSLTDVQNTDTQGAVSNSANNAAGIIGGSVSVDILLPGVGFQLSSDIIRLQ